MLRYGLAITSHYSQGAGGREPIFWVPHWLVKEILLFIANTFLLVWFGWRIRRTLSSVGVGRKKSHTVSFVLFSSLAYKFTRILLVPYTRDLLDSSQKFSCLYNLKPAQFRPAVQNQQVLIPGNQEVAVSSDSTGKQDIILGIPGVNR
jgi:hypothetical protein